MPYFTDDGQKYYTEQEMNEIREEFKRLLEIVEKDVPLSEEQKIYAHRQTSEEDLKDVALNFKIYDEIHNISGDRSKSTSLNNRHNPSVAADRDAALAYSQENVVIKDKPKRVKNATKEIQGYKDELNNFKSVKGTTKKIQQYKNELDNFKKLDKEILQEARSNSVILTE